MSLTTVDAVKTLASITTEAEDAVIGALLQGIDQAVKTWLKRNIESQSYVEYLSGDGRRYLQLYEYPVTAIASLYLDSGAQFGQSADPFPATSLLLSTDYALVKTRGLAGSPGTPVGQNGFLERVGGVWPGVRRRPADSLSYTYDRGSGNVKVTYTAGYASVPADLALAAGLLVLRTRQQLPTGLMATSESLIDYSIAYAQAQGNKGPGADAVSWLIGSTLARYRRVG